MVKNVAWWVRYPRSSHADFQCSLDDNDIDYRHRIYISPWINQIGIYFTSSIIIEMYNNRFLFVIEGYIIVNATFHTFLLCLYIISKACISCYASLTYDYEIMNSTYQIWILSFSYSGSPSFKCCVFVFRLILVFMAFRCCVYYTSIVCVCFVLFAVKCCKTSVEKLK